MLGRTTVRVCDLARTTGISLARPGVHSKALDLLWKYAITVFAMRLTVLGPILFILAGCFSTGTKLTPDQIASVRKGESYNDVIDSLGEPDRVQIGSDGRKMITYAYGEATAFSGVKTQVLLLMFDKDGILQNFQQSSSH
jgi:outer membrane protein assembly factor BamE (lipoprotein component of BamABCDE complex)